MFQRAQTENWVCEKQKLNKIKVSKHHRNNSYHIWPLGAPTDSIMQARCESKNNIIQRSIT